ncbi:uncharacterized protein LOC128670965 isoform X1 [Plodia interpunctella]|uniref:uncharacterized protein LOC128670965 isoform X1 n=1 Tax=Plodia interpunctella TaxID=58824 RepID=UPI002367814E|nr:uncharacterized protein LOC128670965 isoform X1 [Plodia interpunctella]
MSSNDSMSSSRLSQFGLYRTIDARTEEFLKLSRRRQIRQGCACAAISSAVTVTVVVCVVFLYGYGVGVLSPPRASWLDLRNDSDPTLFEDKLQSTVHLDRAAIKLLPIFFDKLLQHDSSSPKYETKSSTEYTFEKDVFAGTNILAKIPNSRLFAIQYKTYPIVYIHSPRNTDNYSKLRKTREYERIMSYVDKMINEKVNFASSRFVRNKPNIESQNLIENIITTPLPHKSLVTKKPKTISKHYTYKHHLPNVNNTQTRTSYKNKNCKCTLEFGILIDKLIKCFQKLSQEFMERPCNNITERKIEKNCIHNTNKSVTTPKSKTQNVRLKPITIVPKRHKEMITSTETPKGIFKVPDNLLQNIYSNNQSTSKAKQLLSWLPSLYSVVDKKISANKETSKDKNFHANQLLLKTNTHVIPKHRNLTFNKVNYENEKYTTFATTTTSSKPTSTKYTSSAAGKFEDIFQEILLPEGNVFELTTYTPKSIKKGYVHFSSPHNYYEITTEKYGFRKPVANVRFKNISDQIVRPPSTPKHPQIYPEEIVFEMFRKKHDRMLKEKKSKEQKPASINKKRLKDSSKNFIGKLKDLSKQMHPQGKNLYKHLPPQIKNNKHLPKSNDDKQISLKKQSVYERITEADSHNVQIPEIPITTTATTTSVTASLPSSIVTLPTSNLSFQNFTVDEPKLLDLNKNIIAKLKILLSKNLYKNSSYNPLPTSNNMPLNLKQNIFSSKEIFREGHVTEITTTTTSTATTPKSKNFLTTLPTSGGDIQKFVNNETKPEITLQALNGQILEVTSFPTQLRTYSQDQPTSDITSPYPTEEQDVTISKSKPVITVPKLERRYNLISEEPWNEFETTDKTTAYENFEQDKKEITSTTTTNITKVSTTDGTKMESKNIFFEDALNILLPQSFTRHDADGAFEGKQSAENAVTSRSLIPVGRKSYLEISRGDWKLSEPHFNTDNVYDAFDEIDNFNK